MGERMTKVKCDCGNEVELDEPRLELVNQLTISAIVWAHPEQTACDRCGMAFVPMFNGIPIDGMKCSYRQVSASELPSGMPVKKKEQSRIISPFGR